MRREAFHDYGKAVVVARLEGRALREEILGSMSQGNAISYRGHRWYDRHLSVLHVALLCQDVSFELLKWLQFPEVNGRLTDAYRFLDEASHTLALVSRDGLPGHQAPAALTVGEVAVVGNALMTP